MANGRTMHMRESAWTLTAVNKRGSVKIGAIPFDGYKRKDRQPPEQVFAPMCIRCSWFMWIVSAVFVDDCFTIDDGIG
ncbi:hypothetical protein [Hoylesella buccalis]|uniref:hypothetical protein n=1 Tax=Hoylesella buccalis TaxID=28127 RepID=UPI003992BC0E